MMTSEFTSNLRLSEEKFLYVIQLNSHSFKDAETGSKER